MCSLPSRLMLLCSWAWIHWPEIVGLFGQLSIVEGVGPRCWKTKLNVGPCAHLLLKRATPSLQYQKIDFNTGLDYLPSLLKFRKSELEILVETNKDPWGKVFYIVSPKTWFNLIKKQTNKRTNNIQNYKLVQDFAVCELNHFTGPGQARVPTPTFLQTLYYYFMCPNSRFMSCSLPTYSTLQDLTRKNRKTSDPWIIVQTKNMWSLKSPWKYFYQKNVIAGSARHIISLKQT